VKLVDEHDDALTVAEACDNCPDMPNYTQLDSDGNGIGDVCQNRCGNVNGDAVVNVSDAVFLINTVFRGGPPPPSPEAADANCDGGVNISDAVYLINLVFRGGPEPCAECK
jgi:hypothetical protein